MATGPSTTTSPYITAYEPNVRFASILTAGDSVGVKADGVTPWRFAGIPDGLGAFDNGDGTMTVLVTHELGATSGVVREHGSAGAFISQLTINTSTLEVVAAEDAIKQVFLSDGVTFTAGTTAYARFCSADLAAPAAYFNEASGLGTTARIFLAGEETGPEGRVFGNVVTGAAAGNSYQLAALGRFSWENAVASPTAQDKTIVVGTDDATPGQVYVYVGDKQASGNDVERAGLTGGKTYGIVVPEIGFNAASENNATSFGADGASTFTLADLGDLSTVTGADLETASDAAGVSEFFRPEDAAWDPTNPNFLYFATTANFAGNSRLYRLEFTDIENPELGGTIRMLLDGTEGHRMLDNLTVSNEGLVYIQEDVGNNPRLGVVWEYNPATDTLAAVGEHDAGRFLAPVAPFTQDEESSGIIDVTELLGDADTQAFLLDVQAHYTFPDPEIVQGGQLLAMFIDEVKDGGSGDDRVAGDANDNVLSGNRGNDEMLGGSGNDSLYGGRGTDIMDGGRGNDVLQGGLDGDIFAFDTIFDGTTDYISDFLVSDGDTLRLGEGVTVTAASVGYLTTGDTANGQALTNSSRALDLVLTLSSAAGSQTLHILDTYNFRNDAFWESQLGIELDYPQLVSTGVNLLPIA